MTARIVPGAAASTNTKRKQQNGAAAAFATSKGDPLATASTSKPEQSSGAQSGRPDKAAHEREVQAVDAEIQRLQGLQEGIRGKINGKDPNGNPLVQQRNALRQELNGLREQQAGSKASRGKVMDTVKSMQDRLQVKIKDLQTAKAKFPYKSVQDVDNRILSLDRQVEGGNLKLVDERKTLNEISNLKKSRKTIESFDTQQAAIESDKQAIEEQRKLLDDPESKAASEKYNTLKAELDKLNEQLDESSKSRNKQFEERDAIKKQIDEQWAKKRELRDSFRAANDAYYQKANEERNKRMERMRTEKAAYEESKRKEVNERLLEEASAPAYEREIEDCGTLIDYFSRGKGASAPTLKSVSGEAPSPIKALASVQAFDLRKVSTDLPEGTITLKKKGEDEENFYVGGGGKKKGRGQRQKNADGAAKTDAASQSLNLPMSTLAGLLALEIPAPLSTGDVAQTIQALQDKQKYMKENQSRVTKERIEKAQARIDRASKEVPLQNSKPARIDASTNSNDEPNGYREEAVLETPAQEKITANGGEVDGEQTADAEEPSLANGDAEAVTSKELEQAAK